MIDAQIRHIEFFLPETQLTNEDLARTAPQWTAEKIEEKTGIASRRVAGKDETSADLAYAAGKKLLDSGAIKSSDIDFVLLCTQSPDFFLPTTACLLQHRLGIPTTAGALDFNLGCSGFVYGLGLAKGLIETGQAKNVLLLTAETYTKFINERDMSVRTIFGDGAAATLVSAGERNDEDGPSIGPFVYGTDGSGGNNLCVPVGGMRHRTSDVAGETQVAERGPENLYMNGPEIFSFTLRSVPAAVKALTDAGHTSMDGVDLFVFHQANKFMLDHLRKKIGIPEQKFVIALREFGNTVSATIPIALAGSKQSGVLQPGMKIAVVGFGVGYSWAAALLRW